MATTYQVLNTTAQTAQAGYRDATPRVFNSNRLFFRFDLTGSGLILADLGSAIFQFNVTAVLGTDGHYTVRSDPGGNDWGTTIDATAADFTSTDTSLEWDSLINSTGIKSATVDPAHLNLNGWNYIRIGFANASGGQKRITVNMQEATTQANRPQLILTKAGMSMMQLMGIGGVDGEISTFFGHASDGQLRANDSSEPDIEIVP